MIEVTARTRLMAVIGSPIEHSLSPRIHNAFARRFDLDCVYLAFHVTPETLPAFVQAARTLNMAGFNVTMPLKTHIAPLLDALDNTARDNAVNTVYVREGGLTGASTDGDGFMKSLESVNFVLPEKALILGAGGASRAIAGSLARKGVTVTVASRRTVNFEMEGMKIKFCGWDEIVHHLPECGLLVNATPLGMSGAGAGDFTDLGFLGSLPRQAMVYDLLYDPRVSKLLKHADMRGFRTMNGLRYLVSQAALSFGRFTGRNLTDGDTEEVLAELERDT